jgi:hypothetical protein
VVEYWSIGVVIKPKAKVIRIESFLQYITPSLHYSIIPVTKIYLYIDKFLQINVTLTVPIGKTHVLQRKSVNENKDKSLGRQGP